MSAFEKSLIKERQMKGIRVRKQKGLCGGRKKGSVDTPERFLNKPKSKKLLSTLTKGLIPVRKSVRFSDVV